MERTNNKSIFISNIYDSREKNTIWHRAVFNGPERKKDFSVTFYSSNTLVREYNGKEINIADVLSGEEILWEQKKTILKPYFRREVYGFKDMLLHDIRGRYLWFIMEYYAAAGQRIKTEDIRIYFPKKTWLSYLPEVYADDKESALFIERFLCIFQSLYEDLNEKIQYSPISFLPEVCDLEFLQILATWLNEKNDYLWTEKQLRYLLSHAMEFYSYRGTVKSLNEIISLYTGEEPYIIEHHQWEKEREGKRRKILISLYEDNPFSFTLLVKEKYVPGNAEYKIISKIIKEVIPAHMQCRLVVLRPYLFLNSYSYLEINSVLGKYQPFDLTKAVVIPLSSLTIKSREDREVSV